MKEEIKDLFQVYRLI